MVITAMAIKPMEEITMALLETLGIFGWKVKWSPKTGQWYKMFYYSRLMSSKEDRDEARTKAA